MNDYLLDIRDLKLAFKNYAGLVEVLHGISLNIRRGREGRAGRRIRLRQVGDGAHHPRSAAGVEIRTYFRVGAFRGQDLEALALRTRLALRGTKISMIFQDPTSSLNPVYTIGIQFNEVLRRGNPDISERDAEARAIALLKDVSIPEPERVLVSYPFQLSGGMNQRVMIAMALANEPSLLIADEPGTALDVTVQAQTLHLMRDLVERRGTSVLFISHNLGVVREFADRVYVIYKGRLVEHGETVELFHRPRHPYTRALMAAVPRITGGGIPEISEADAGFTDPMIDHGVAS